MKRIKTALVTSLLFIATGVFILSSCNNNGDVVYGPTTLERPCENVFCLNGGNCFDGRCNCLIGFEGATCGDRSSTKFVAQYTAFDECYTGNPETYTTSITDDSQDPTKLVLNNFGVYCTAFPLVAYLDKSGTSFTIPLQQSCDNLFIEGNASISGNILNVSLHARDTVLHASQRCSIIMNK